MDLLEVPVPARPANAGVGCRCRTVQPVLQIRLWCVHARRCLRLIRCCCGMCCCALHRGPLCMHAFGVRTSGWAARSRAIRVCLRHGQATCPRPSTWSRDLKSCWSRLRNCARDAPHEALCSQAQVLGQDEVQKWEYTHWCGGVAPLESVEATVLDDRLCLQPGHICKPCKPRLSGHMGPDLLTVCAAASMCVVQACRTCACLWQHL